MKLLVAIVVHPRSTVFISVGLLLLWWVDLGFTCGMYWAMHSFLIWRHIRLGVRAILELWLDGFVDYCSSKNFNWLNKPWATCSINILICCVDCEKISLYCRFASAIAFRSPLLIHLSMAFITISLWYTQLALQIFPYIFFWYSIGRGPFLPFEALSPIAATGTFTFRV